jgi:hypothetical protein
MSDAISITAVLEHSIQNVTNYLYPYHIAGLSKIRIRAQRVPREKPSKFRLGATKRRVQRDLMLL